MNNQSLEQQISRGISLGDIRIETDKDISNNLNPKFKLRPYQKEALARFDYVVNQHSKILKPTQLLFHMATGSGKTLVMASVILHLYKRGYRNFIFFVNSSNIIEKTRDNFLNSISSKYLFNETISIADNKIVIKEVDNFETANKDDINIVFTTIQGLHSRLNTPKENSLTYEDFEDTKIVLLSDEAHHINAETKKGKPSKDEVESILSWESTVNKIFNANNENLLLEFTATADLHHQEIKKKYFDKLLFDYSLKQFRKDKYSKDVQVLQADLSQFERALQAVILSQYRRKIFEQNKLNIKPVILLKSKTIGESKAFFDEFVMEIKNLTPTAVNNIRNNSNSKIIQQIFNFFDERNISTSNLISELKEDFSENKCISVNSKNDSDEKQLIINSLEDENNEYRAVFAVDKLNEGWDVLNLFDIVRLYNTKNTEHKNDKIGKTTMSEAQLIGRGARYCPFKIDDNQELYKRKYDDNLTNNLRICEELYYHSAHNPKYISELNRALVEIGLKPINRENNNIPKSKNTRDNGVEKRQKNKLNSNNELDKKIREKIYKKKFLSGNTSISNAFEITPSTNIKAISKIYVLGNFEQHILLKAVNKLTFYRFNNLLKYFPKLKSISEFLSSEKFISKIKVEIKGNKEQVENLSNQMKLEIAISVFDEVSKSISKN